ncbi:TetR/AcrR family transcriptional regulator [Secundilactobacillus paracollinoides]|uniref:TetR/AcrR family transcriptional regulator n=1 Tax=Secundilactobacillus paracollinoides TaxID=240427 RepID=UPI0006CF3674|nr:TetR/AcrR family transcriptional regulator [Secundilactobacillus paracollinoides]KRL78851.1 hypothetical protein FC17_GL000867 [Secundilactobacillus paracollinoides DSM 15502 = JCM 11969]
MTTRKPSKPTIDARIRAAYLDLLQTTRFDRIKVKTLILNAGVSHGSFYIYYDSALDVLEDIEDQFLEQLAAKSYTPQAMYQDAHPTDELFNKLTSITEQMPTFKRLLGPNGDPYFERKMSRFFDKKLDDYFQNTPSQDPLSQQLIQQAVDGARWSLLTWWAQHSEQLSTAQLAQFLYQYMKMIVTLTTK